MCKCGKPIKKCGCNEVHPDYCEEGLLQRVPTYTVFYTGAPTPFLQLPTGMDMETFVKTVDQIISNLQDQIDSITPTPVGNLESKVVSLSGDGSTFSFPVLNDFTTPATSVQVIPSSQDAQGIQLVIVNSQNITISYEIAPPPGTNNLNYTILKLS